MSLLLLHLGAFVLTSFNRVLLGFTGFYWVLPSFTGFHPTISVFLLGYSGFYWFFIGLYIVLLGFIWFRRVSLGYSGFYWFFIGLYIVLLGFIWFRRVSLGLTRFYLVLVCFYWVIQGYTGLYHVLLGFTIFTGFLLGYTRFYWVLLGLTMLYRVMPSFRGLNCVLGSFLEGKNTNKWNARRWSRWFGAGVALLFSVAVKKKCHRPAHAIGPSADRTGHAPPIAPPHRHHLAAVLSLHRFLSAFFSSI